MHKKRPLSHKNITPFKQFHYGVCYYPEHWQTSDMQNDAQRMAQMGVNVVRMADFAWSILEPEEGKYQFHIFDEAIRRLSEHNIQVILCTPTAAPPRWLSQKHPQIVRVDEDGIAMQHGSRQHTCYSNAVYIDYCCKITHAMADHFAANEHVIGWQPDNEFNCKFSLCHCQSCQDSFSEYLSSKYQNNINALNEAWGTVFWSQIYDNFKQIPTPRVDKPSQYNPAHRLDYLRYLSGMVTEFQHHQADILRAANPNWWITHNGLFPNLDYRGDFTQDLDVLGYDMYPMFCSQHSARRLSQAYSLDRTRACSGNFMILEHQAGAGGQPSYMLDNPVPGEMRAMTYSSIARGADALLYFRWRTCRVGAEQYWCGIIDHDNIPRRRYQEATQVGQELKKVGKEILDTSVHVDCAIADMDFDNMSVSAIAPWGMPDISTASSTIHHWLNRRQYAVGLIHPEDDLSDISLYFIPHWQMFDQTWTPALHDYVRAGGTLVIGGRTATHDKKYHVLSQTPPGPLAPLAGIKVTEYGKQNHPGERPMNVLVGDQTFLSEHWYEQLSIDDDVQTLGVWANSHLVGEPAITCKKVGKGHVIYVGTYLTQPLLDVLMPELLKLSNVKPLCAGLSESVEIVQRSNEHKTLQFVINRSDNTVYFPYHENTINLLSTDDTSQPNQQLAPWEVRLYQL